MSVTKSALEATGGTLEDQPKYPLLFGLSWLHFLNDGASNYLPGVLPAVLVALNQSDNLAGSMMSALLIGQTLQVASGWLADYVGGRMFIVMGVLGSNLAAMAIGLAPNLAVLIPALVIIGISNALFHPQALAGARRLSGARLGFGMALFLIGGEFGRGIWPLFATLVVGALGLRHLWILGLPALVSVPLLWRRLPRQIPRHPDARPITWRLKPVSALIAFAVFRSLTVFGAVAFLPFLWHIRGRSLTEGAALIAVMLVVGIVGNVGGGHLADRIGRRPVLLGSSLIGSTLLVGFLLSNGPLRWIFLGLFGMSMFATPPLAILIGQDIFPENRSLGSAIALGLANGIAAIGLAALDLVSSAHGPLTVLWLLVGSALLAGLSSIFLPGGGGPKTTDILEPSD